MPSTEGQCSHISTFLEDSKLVTQYKAILTWSTNRHISSRNSPAKRRKLSVPTCSTCKEVLPRPLVCLQCSYVGCWSNRHTITHATESKHPFCIDSNTGYLFCTACHDFVYDFEVDKLRLLTVVAAEEKKTNYRISASGKLREPFQFWKPSAEEKAQLDSAEVLPCQGRRGLLNLGQTCFLNVILQSFIHNPLLRNYFLGDKHNHETCTVEDCSCCEMDILFSEIFSGQTTPFGPTSFLTSTWRKSEEFAGYAQQDAHEFLISALNHIHSNTRGSTKLSCNCIIHSTFEGKYQSDVECEKCHNVTSTVDPMFDLSLELKGSGENTLIACLRKFTTPEKLGKEYSCVKCKTSHEATKHLSIRKLPPVLSFQFKRFEQKGAGAARKLDAVIRFPATLNMAPYTSFAQKDPDHAGPEALYEYELFAVINHEGQMDNGHYTNFARLGDEWYHFDDDKVTHTTLSACLNSVAYMCFYVKKHLEYQPYVTPTYVKKREMEAAKEKEMEREKQAKRTQEVDAALLALI